MRQAKGFDEWNQLLALGQIIVGAIPHFGKGRKPKVDLMHLNPFAESPQERKVSRGIPLRGSMGVAVLNACSVEAPDG